MVQASVKARTVRQRDIMRLIGSDILMESHEKSDSAHNVSNDMYQSIAKAPTHLFEASHTYYFTALSDVSADI